MWVVGHAAMAVAEQVPSAVVRAVPDLHRVVAADDALDAMRMLRVADLHRDEVVGALPLRGEVRRLAQGLVVVAPDDVFASLECLRDLDGAANAAEAEVAEMPDLVACADGAVPVVDEDSVHGVDRREGAVSVGEDATMCVVCVGSEEGGHSKASSRTATSVHSPRCRSSSTTVWPMSLMTLPRTSSLLSAI